MTVSANANSVTYLGTGTTGPFNVPFKIADSSQLVVSTIVIATGVITTLAPAAYAYTGFGSPNGSLTLTSALPSTSKVRIDRIVPYTQTLDISNEDGFLPENIEAAMDALEMQIQQVNQHINDLVNGILVTQYGTAVAGPGAATDSNLAAFNGTTGNILKDSGKKVTDFAAAAHTHAFNTLTGIPTTVAGYGITDIGTYLDWTTVVKTATTTITGSATLTADAELKFAMAANKTYLYYGEVECNNTANGFALGHLGPSTPTRLSTWTVQYSAAWANGQQSVYGATVTFNANAGLFRVIMNGLIENGANAGNFSVAMAQNTSGAGVLTVYKGSYLRWRLLA